MRRGLALAVVLLATAGTSAPAEAQISDSDLASAHFATYAEGRASGHVRVDFHGDEAAGCAALRVCDVSGTVTWQPRGGAALFTVEHRRGGRRFASGNLFFGQGDEDGPSQLAETVARVRRAGHLCSDVAAPPFAVVGLGPDRGSSLTARLASPAPTATDSDSLRTRCAGPSLADVAAVLPAHVLSRRALRRGHERLDFSADAPFAAHGFAGRVRSNVVVKLGRASSGDPSREARGPEIDRRRVISLHYRVESVTGTARMDFAGLDDSDLCEALDACGLTGSVTVTPRVSGGSASIVGSISPARRRRDDLRRALGLLSGKARRRHDIFGSVRWERDRGSVTSELARGGAADCHDAQPAAPDGSILLQTARGQLYASYGTRPLATWDPLRTRCPGPGYTDATQQSSLASGTLPLSALRQRRVTLRLTRGRTFRGNGYRGVVRPDITVVLRRVAVRERIVVEREEELRPLPKRALKAPMDR